MKKIFRSLIIGLVLVFGASPLWAQTGSQNPVFNGASPFQLNTSLPTVTAGCQGAGVVQPAAATSNGNRGFFTGQTSAATTCTLTWPTAWQTAPQCTFFDAHARITPLAYSETAATTTTTVVVSFVSEANPIIGYMCF